MVISTNKQFSVNNYSPIATRSSVLKESEQWEIDVVPVAKGFYGYGYGPDENFQQTGQEITNGLDYFNVLGVNDTNLGYGIDGTQGTEEFNGFVYGWGYEFGNSVMGNTLDPIVVRAQVTENEVPQANVKVVFLGSVGVSLSEEVVYTDSDGNAYTSVTVDSTVQYRHGYPVGNTFGFDFNSLPDFGYVTIKAFVDKNPGQEENVKTISLDANQLFFEDVQYDKSIGCYGYQYQIPQMADDNLYVLNNAPQAVKIYDSLAENAIERSIFVLAARPTTGTADGFRVYINGTDYGEYNFVPTGTFVSAWNGDLYDNTATGIVIEDTVDVVEVHNSGVQLERGKTIGIIEGSGIFEIISIQDITEVSTGVYRLTNILRNVHGTSVGSVLDGVRIWILDQGPTALTQMNDISISNSINLDSAITVLVKAYNGFYESPSVSTTYTYQYIPETPFAPYNLVNNSGTVSWDARRRRYGFHYEDCDEVLPVDLTEYENGTWYFAWWYGTSTIPASPNVIYTNSVSVASGNTFNVALVSEETGTARYSSVASLSV